MAALHGLLWIAQQPQDHDRKDPTSPTAVLLEVVQGLPLLQVCAGSGQLTKPPQALAHLPVTGHKERWVTLALGQAEELLCQLKSRLVLRLLYIEVIEPPQRRKELLAIPHLLTQLPRPGIGL